MSDPIKLTFEQASDPNILAVAHLRASELGVSLEIAVEPLGQIEYLTPEQASNHVTYMRAVKRAGGDYRRVKVKSE